MQRTHVLLASILLLTIAVCTQAQDPDLLGWWKFDDGTGTIAVDSSGRAVTETTAYSSRTPSGLPESSEAACSLTARAVSVCHSVDSIFPREP